MSLTDLLWEWHPTYYNTTFTECMVRCLILYTWQQDEKDLNSEIKRCGLTYCPCSVWTNFKTKFRRAEGLSSIG